MRQKLSVRKEVAGGLVRATADHRQATLTRPNGVTEWFASDRKMTGFYKAVEAAKKTVAETSCGKV